jgi:cation:H+ antiporter
VVGFLIIALISVLPETLISINAAIQGVPAFGLGTLFGSNIADLTLILGLVIFFAREIKIQKNILRMNQLFVLCMGTPLLFGLNGHYSRIEGFLLILVCILFYVSILKTARKEVSDVTYTFSKKNLAFLLLSMGLLLISAHFTVEYGVALAQDLNIPPILIGMFLVGLGTTLPELFFSVKAVKKNRDGLAIGDILGTVITDATFVIGIMAIISPFTFNPNLIFGAGFFMFLAALLLFHFMKSERILTKKEGLLLIFFYLCYVVVEILLNQNS